MHNRPRAALLLLLVSGLLAACNGGAGSGSTVEGTPESTVASAGDGTATGGAATQLITLGVVQSLSGAGGIYGPSAVEGTKLAIEEIEAADPNIQIDYTVVDDKSDADAGVAAYQGFVDQKVTAIFGSSLSTVGFPALKVAEDAGVPAVSPITTASGIGAIGDYVFRIALAEEVSLPALVEFVAERSPIHEAVLVFDSSDAYSRSAADAMRQGVATIGATIVKEVDLSTAPDLAAVFADPSVSAAQAVLLPVLIEQSVTVLQAIQAAGLHPVLVGGEAVATPELAQLAGTAADGMFVSSTWHPAVTGSTSQAFVQAYEKAYGHPPAHFAAESHAGITVLMDAIRRAGSTSPAAIRDALAATKDLDTVLGKLSMSPEGDAVFTPVFQQFMDGQLVIAK